MNRPGTTLLGVAVVAVGALVTYYGLYNPVCTSPGRLLALYCRPNYGLIALGLCVVLVGLSTASKTARKPFSGSAG